MKILIAIPTFENIAPETFKSIYDLQTHHETAFEYCKGYDCAKARNTIAQKAVSGGFDYVLMVDSDIIIPPDTLEKMLEYPVPVCVGVYPRKNTENEETELFKFTERDFTDRFTFQELTTDRIQIKGSGLGCALINVEVFKVIPFPWFRYVTYDDGAVLSEDLFFSDLLRRYNIPMIVDTRIRCGHLARFFQYE